MPDAGPEPVRARFEPGPDPMPFGSVPWPDDLYLDPAGHVSVSDLPGSSRAREYLDALVLGLADLDGFGVRALVHFEFDGALDPASLPATAADTLTESSTVFLVDADTGSPDAFARVAVEAQLDADGRRVTLRPVRPLVPGRRYAAVVTNGVRSEDGRRVGPALRFAALRDPQVTLEDRYEREARDLHAPVLETLVGRGLPREDVVALAVFRVQSVATDLDDARALVHERDPITPTADAALAGAALDAVLGPADASAIGVRPGVSAPHSEIGWLVHGSFGAPSLLSAERARRGAFERTEANELRVKREASVPFSLVLPREAFETSALPVVIFLHGLERERSDGLAVANALAAAGYAVLMPDAPFHGSRIPEADTTHRFTGADGPDGFGDVAGDAVGASDEDAELAAFHPFLYRDALRQGVVELFALVRAIGEADWSELLGAVDPALVGVGLDAGRVGVVGIDMGAELGLMLASVEPAVDALAIAFVGGPTLDGWLWSPARAELVEAWATRVGRDASALADPSDPVRFWPEAGVWQTLVDRADPLAHAARLRGRPVSLLAWIARDDEVVHDRAVEALALELGAVLVGDTPRHEPDLDIVTLGAGATLSGNFAIGDDPVTRVLYALDPATHDTLVTESGTARYAHPVEVPFEPLDAPETVDNPLAPVLTQLVFYFESRRACVAPAEGAGCPASVLASE